MFHRDAASADDFGASDSPFAWPPGFRERRTNFASSSPAEPSLGEASASASASSSSSPFRHHQQSPHFHAHRKSSDQVIQQLRDELDRHRQMFFDRLAPQQWDQQRAGFPFSDSGIRRAFADATDRAMPHHHFHHEDIPSWMTEDDHQQQQQQPGARRQRWPSGGSARSGASSSSTASSSGGGGGHAPDGETQERRDRSDSPGLPRIHKPATRSATGDFPAASPGSPKMSFNRAGSAPPAESDASTSFSGGVPRRGFVINREQQPQQQQQQQQQPAPQSTDSPGARRRSQSNQQQQGNGHVVRHIPIVVEGRDEPLLPSVAEEDAAEKRSKTAIPMPFYPATTGDAATKESDASSGTSAPKQAKVNQKEEDDERDGTIPIPLPYDRLGGAGGGGATPPTSAAERQTAADLEQISRIQRETETLLPRIESFRGDRHHRDFLYLDEMLTRLLLKLDNVQVEGRDDVRRARRQAIASITQCINLLESKLLDSIDRSSQEPESCSPPAAQQCVEADAPGSEQEACGGRDEQQRHDDAGAAEKVAPLAPPPVTHVTQLVINIGGPPASEAPCNAEPIQEVN